MTFDVLIRLDAGGSVGLGHLRRCLSLALAFRRKKKRVGFITRNPDFVRAWTRGRFPVLPLKSNSMEWELVELHELLAWNTPSLLVIDHYQYKPYHAEDLKSHLWAVSFIDDTASWKSYPVDAIINHNVDAPRLPYPKNGPKLFLGTQYCLIPEEIKTYRNKKIPAGLKLFMTLGGGAKSAQVAKLLASFKVIRSKVRGAKAYLAAGLDSQSKKQAPGVNWVKPHEFIRGMSKCSLAVSSSGVTSYELACLGIPSFLVIMADNQAGICREMAKRGCALYGGWFDKLTALQIANAILKLWNSSRLQAMSRAGKKLVGLRGPDKLTRALIKEFLS